jgi:hypothetical protein
MSWATRVGISDGCDQFSSGFKRMDWDGVLMSIEY